jgi:uncharacterized SAM-binding protein YcdF (DUF218 family)
LLCERAKRLVNKMMQNSRPRGKSIIKFLLMSLIILVVAVSLYPEWFLLSIGKNLVKQDELQPADAIVVLAGSFSGNRVREAVSLMQKGYGKFIVFSGVQVYPGVFTHRFMKDYAVELGLPESQIITQVLKHERSTIGEAVENLASLRAYGFKSMILVTSGYHTRRSYAVYQRLIASGGIDIKLMVYPAYDPDIPVDGWWKTREGIKQIFLEYFKLVFYSSYELKTV